MEHTAYNNNSSYYISVENVINQIGIMTGSQLYLKSVMKYSAQNSSEK